MLKEISSSSENEEVSSDSSEADDSGLWGLPVPLFPSISVSCMAPFMITLEELVELLGEVLHVGEAVEDMEAAEVGETAARLPPFPVLFPVELKELFPLPLSSTLTSGSTGNAWCSCSTSV